jgi:biopolymer transport protein ExbD
VVSLDAQGNYRLGNEALPVTADALRRDLLARVEKNPELKLAISADKAAPVGQLVKVMDAVREANIKSVSMFTKEATK